MPRFRASDCERSTLAVLAQHHGAVLAHTLAIQFPRSMMERAVSMNVFLDGFLDMCWLGVCGCAPHHRPLHQRPTRQTRVHTCIMHERT